MAEGVPTNNQRGRRSGPCRLWGGLDKARHIVPTALLVRVQCFRKSLEEVNLPGIVFVALRYMSLWCYTNRRHLILSDTWSHLCAQYTNEVPPCSTIFMSPCRCIRKKKEEIWLSLITKAPTSTEKSKKQRDQKKNPKNFDYTTIVDRLRMVRLE